MSLRSECNAAGCSAMGPRGQAFCQDHWRSLPKGLQTRIIHTRAGYLRLLSDQALARYRKVRNEAVELIARREGRLIPYEEKG